MPHPADPAVPRRPSASAFRRFRRSADGATAVEFALVAMPFLGLVGAIFQIAFQIWATQNFDRALQDGVRRVFTGQFQSDNAGKSDTDMLKALKQRICGPATATIVNVFNCQNVRIDVTTSDTFAGASPSTPINTATGTWNTAFGSRYACAKPGTIVTVTAAVPFPTFFNLLGLRTVQFTSGSDSGAGLLTSTAVFRTEPYQAQATTC